MGKTLLELETETSRENEKTPNFQVLAQGSVTQLLLQRPLTRTSCFSPSQHQPKANSHEGDSAWFGNDSVVVGHAAGSVKCSVIYASSNTNVRRGDLNFNALRPSDLKAEIAIASKFAQNGSVIVDIEDIIAVCTTTVRRRR